MTEICWTAVILRSRCHKLKHALLSNYSHGYRGYVWMSLWKQATTRPQTNTTQLNMVHLTLTDIALHRGILPLLRVHSWNTDKRLVFWSPRRHMSWSGSALASFYIYSATFNLLTANDGQRERWWSKTVNSTAAASLALSASAVRSVTRGMRSLKQSRGSRRSIAGLCPPHQSGVFREKNHKPSVQPLPAISSREYV